MKFKAEDYIGKFSDIPSAWIFEHYLNLEKLEGQTVMLNSIFNDKDDTPSLAIYYNVKNKNYYYKCFSTGKYGNSVDLVKFLFKLNGTEAVAKIYKDYKEQPERSSFVYKNSPWVLSNYKTREWRLKDKNFWSQFGITKKTLEKYKVAPLENYILVKDSKYITVTNHLSYGYFCDDGIYKIYNPGNKHKFVKIQSYLQGSEQLKNNKNLLIAKSLKDIMTLKSLGFNLDMIAPDCENCILHKDLIEDLKKRYSNIAVYLDSDTAGIKAMKQYKELYKLPFVFYGKAKDISDAYRDIGKECKYDIAILINQKIN